MLLGCAAHSWNYAAYLALSGIQCFSCKELLRSARNQKGQKITLITRKRCCTNKLRNVSLQAEQADWIGDTDEEIDEQELKAHYSFMAKIQEVLPAESGSDAEPLEKLQYDVEYNMFANERQHSEQPESINDTHGVEKDDSNVIPDSSNMCDNDNQANQNANECDDEHVMLANLIANLKLDTDENKKIQKQLKKQTHHSLMNYKSASLHLKNANLVLRSLIELEIDT
ncbi:hypothetical protein Tco_1191520 [Tanacetum coccineum]